VPGFQGISSPGTLAPGLAPALFSNLSLQPHIVTAATHDDDDTAVVADEETYETHYGLRDPMLDVLHRSYLHVWTIKGAHARFVTYVEHTSYHRKRALFDMKVRCMVELLSKHSAWLGL
jgi:hypothetical protein